MSKRKYFFTSSKKSPTNDDDDDHLRESKYPRIKIDDSTIDTMDVEDVDYSSSYLVPLSPSPSPSPSPSCHSPSYSTYCITNHDDNSVSNELKKMNLNNVEMGFNVCNTTLDITDKMLTVVGGASSVAKNFSEFAPLISSFLNVGNEIIKLYKKAKQHKELCGFLLKRCKFAMAAVEDLDLRKTENVEFFSKQEHLTLFLGFINCMEGIKSFIAEVSQLKTLQKYLYTNSIEEKFTNLATEFDGYMQNLNFSFTIQSRDELLTVKNEIQQIKEILLSYGVPDDRKSQQNFFDVTNLVTEKNIEFQEQSRKRMVIDSSKLEENEPLLDGNEFSKTSISPSKRIEKRTSYKNSDDVCFKEFSNNSSATLTKQEETQIEIRRQVNILKLLKDSEHIIRFYGVAHDDNKYYLVTEWMKHGNLHEYYTKCKDSINLETKIKFALDICRGVAYLHECEILHRDIQSANILVNGHNKVKIANFGLSRKFSDITRNILQNLENIRYMAPEKLLITNNGDTKKRKISYDSKCEIYSVGALLWEIAELKKPHSDLESEPIINIRERVKKRYCLPFTNSVPPEWEHVVTKAMEYDPKWRINISEICREFYKMSEKYSGYSGLHSLNVSFPSCVPDHFPNLI
ncbi:kinase-like protein [Rhizophagus irregularis]|uniref:Kinase-like protein n=1 Tax=Rhizophagus irregularis TaxID=588596 RepID=A0A2I1GNB2_9GLOM|nr:kinase-like protein [Rhizophagus irregularis]